MWSLLMVFLLISSLGILIFCHKTSLSSTTYCPTFVQHEPAIDWSSRIILPVLLRAIPPPMSRHLLAFNNRCGIRAATLCYDRSGTLFFYFLPLILVIMDSIHLMGVVCIIKPRPPPSPRQGPQQSILEQAILKSAKH